MEYTKLDTPRQHDSARESLRWMEAKTWAIFAGAALGTAAVKPSEAATIADHMMHEWQRRFRTQRPPAAEPPAPAVVGPPTA